jgi:uncharacterized lipoprotein YbaY/heat shock protein HslJ
MDGRHDPEVLMKLADTALLGAAWLLGALFTGCSPRPRVPEAIMPVGSAAHVVVGTATYRERIALPDDAIFEATLLDVSRLDAPGTAIAQTVIVNPPQVPIEFRISFDTALIAPERNYVVRTRIVAEGRPQWVSERAYRVLTNGAARSVQAIMRRTGSSEYRTPEDSVVLLSGEFAYLGDVASITECSSRRIFPVSMEGEFPPLLKTYLELARPPGKALYVTFEGAIANRTRRTGSGMAATVIIRDFIGAWPKQTCANAMNTLPLLKTPWRITALDGQRLTSFAGKEPRLELRRDSTGVQYSATVGCNGIGGEVQIDGARLAFANGIGTLMSCGDQLDSLERQLRRVLERTASWQILGNTMRLRDKTGSTIALLEAVL